MQSELNNNNTSIKAKNLLSISPIDGRYYNKTNDLVIFFSEFGLIKYRINVEIEYYIFLHKLLFGEIKMRDIIKLRSISKTFNLNEALKVKDIESKTNHDVKAVEYYIKQKMTELEIDQISHYIHYGLTSQDINNTALTLLIKDFVEEYYLNTLGVVLEELYNFGNKYNNLPMLSRTHGQAASPTLLGKEFLVFFERIKLQMVHLCSIEFTTKFGGAVGNLNAHHITYPEINWTEEMDNFVNTLGLIRQRYTTQIENYDNLASLFDNVKRINTIMIDMCRDIWTYISLGYFNQKFRQEEVGSSAMPHKINPINFENAEGNFMLGNTLFQFLSSKLPISRLQRDLTDSTVTRNIGVAFSHTIIGFKSFLQGFNKLEVNFNNIKKDLDNNWIVVSEGIQTLLKREGIKNGYEILKDLTRNNNKVGRKEIHQFINKLEVSEKIKQELCDITPFNYTGK